MISLTRRITLGTVVLTVVVVGLAIVLVWMAARWQAIHAMDAELAEHAANFRFMTAHPLFRPAPDHELGREPGQGPGPRPPPWMEKRPPLPGMGRVLVQIVEAEGGREYFRSGETDAALSAALATCTADAPVWSHLDDGRLLRALRLVVQPQGGPPESPALVGIFAIEASATMAELGRMAITLLAVWLVASSLAILAAWWLRRSVIGPIQHLATAIRAIEPGGEKIHIQAEVPREMAPVVTTLNELLDRQAELLAREKCTIANIAHELRSPISGLRTTLEVAALDKGTKDPDLVARCLPTVVAMHTMVMNLLALARLEAGQEQVHLQDVALGELVDACWATIQPIADGRNLYLERSGKSGLVHTNPDKARMVIGNLLDNAITHSPAGSVISMTTEAVDGVVWLRIANVIAGPPPDPTRLFEPFWRGDSARTSPQHCGLGLALARRLAVLLGAELRVEVMTDRFTVHLGLPGVS
jgi:signal transduction histidine kinase